MHFRARQVSCRREVMEREEE
jgi:hypothetical protein